MEKFHCTSCNYKATFKYFLLKFSSGSTEGAHDKILSDKLNASCMVRNWTILKKYIACTPQPIYNTVRYHMVLDTTGFKDGPKKCMDYIEK